MRVVHGDTSIDHPANGKSNQMCRAQCGFLQQTGDLIGEDRQGERALCRSTLPMAIKVITQNAIPAAERWQMGLPQR